MKKNILLSPFIETIKPGLITSDGLSSSKVNLMHWAKVNFYAKLGIWVTFPSLSS